MNILKANWVEDVNSYNLENKYESKYVCSFCGWRTHKINFYPKMVGSQIIPVYTEYNDVFYNFCPNCGAEMKYENNFTSENFRY